MYLEEWPRSAGDGTKGGDLDLRREKRQTATQGNRGRGRPGKYVGLSPDKARLLQDRVTEVMLGLTPGPPLLPQPSSWWSWLRTHAHPMTCP